MRNLHQFIASHIISALMHSSILSGPGIMIPFAAAIMSQNKREIDIAESISVSIKVIIASMTTDGHGIFPIMMSLGLPQYM